MVVHASYVNCAIATEIINQARKLCIHAHTQGTSISIEVLEETQEPPIQIKSGEHK